MMAESVGFRTASAKSLIAGKAYQKHRLGEPLTDEEVRVGRDEFEKMAMSLLDYGQVFNLAATELLHAHNAFRSYDENRKRDRVRK